MYLLGVCLHRRGTREPAKCHKVAYSIGPRRRLSTGISAARPAWRLQFSDRVWFILSTSREVLDGDREHGCAKERLGKARVQAKSMLCVGGLIRGSMWRLWSGMANRGRVWRPGHRACTREESERLTSGQRRLGDVRLVVIDCGCIHSRSVRSMRHCVGSASCLARGDRVRRSQPIGCWRTAASADGDGGTATAPALLLALENSGRKRVSAGSLGARLCSAERADADTLHELTQPGAAAVGPAVAAVRFVTDSGAGFDLLGCAACMRW